MVVTGPEPLSFTEYSGINTWLVFKYFTYSVLFSLAATLSFFIFSRKWGLDSLGRRKISEPILFKILSAWFWLFALYSVIKIYQILEYGLLDFLLDSRFGRRPIGGLMYLYLIMFPLVLAFSFNQQGPLGKISHC